MLGPRGQNGWYCRQSDVETWGALAGWRGLREPAVRRHFNDTLYAFEPTWGPETSKLMSSLDLNYNVLFLGAGEALSVLGARLKADRPTLFFLWSPHAFVRPPHTSLCDAPRATKSGPCQVALLVRFPCMT